MLCHKANKLLPLAACDELDASQRELLDAHLDQCPTCRRKLADIEATTALIAEGIETLGQPKLTPARRAAVFLAASAEPTAPGESADQNAPKRARRPRLVGWLSGSNRWVEVAAVLAVFALLGALLLPLLQKAKESGSVAESKSNLKQIAIANSAYMNFDSSPYIAPVTNLQVPDADRRVASMPVYEAKRLIRQQTGKSVDQLVRDMAQGGEGGRFPFAQKTWELDSRGSILMFTSTTGSEGGEPGGSPAKAPWAGQGGVRLPDESGNRGQAVGPSDVARLRWPKGSALAGGKDESSRHQVMSESSLMADRAIRSGRGAGRTDAGIKSVHTNPADFTANDWKGSVAWNDNHVSFESAPVVATVYGDKVSPNDNLFLDDHIADSDYDTDGVPGFSVFKDAESVLVWKKKGMPGPVDQDDYVDFDDDDDTMAAGSNSDAAGIVSARRRPGSRDQSLRQEFPFGKSFSYIAGASGWPGPVNPYANLPNVPELDMAYGGQGKGGGKAPDADGQFRRGIEVGATGVAVLGDLPNMGRAFKGAGSYIDQPSRQRTGTDFHDAARAQGAAGSGTDIANGLSSSQKQGREGGGRGGITITERGVPVLGDIPFIGRLFKFETSDVDPASGPGVRTDTGERTSGTLSVEGSQVQTLSGQMAIGGLYRVRGYSDAESGLRKGQRLDGSVNGRVLPDADADGVEDMGFGKSDALGHDTLSLNPTLSLGDRRLREWGLVTGHVKTHDTPDSSAAKWGDPDFDKLSVSVEGWFQLLDASSEEETRDTTGTTDPPDQAGLLLGKPPSADAGVIGEIRLTPSKSELSEEPDDEWSPLEIAQDHFTIAGRQSTGLTGSFGGAAGQTGLPDIAAGTIGGSGRLLDQGFNAGSAAQVVPDADGDGIGDARYGMSDAPGKLSVPKRATRASGKADRAPAVDLIGQVRQLTFNEKLADAQRSEADRNFLLAVKRYQEALSVDPDNAQAQAGLAAAKAKAELGRTPQNLLDKHEKFRNLRRDAAKAEYQAFINKADANLQDRNFVGATDTARNAKIVLDKSRQSLGADYGPMRAEAVALDEKIEKERVAWEQGQRQQAAVDTARIAEETRARAKAEGERQIQDLLKRALESQKKQEYDQALELLDQALFLNKHEFAAKAMKVMIEDSKLYIQRVKTVRERELMIAQHSIENDETQSPGIGLRNSDDGDGQAGEDSTVESKEVARIVAAGDPSMLSRYQDNTEVFETPMYWRRTTTQPSIAEAEHVLAPAATFEAGPVNPFVMAAKDHLSTFALDVDTASYSLARNYIRQGYRPPPASVRMEEFVNAFDYNYPTRSDRAFAVHSAAAAAPFGKGLVLLRVGVKGKVIGRDMRKAAHLVFVIDTSGSMARADRLPLVQYGLKLLVSQLTPGDRVSVVTYGTQASLLLEATPATPGSAQSQFVKTVAALQCQGSTNLASGLALGYQVAVRHFEPGQINRVILLSDGVANIGVTEADAILGHVESYRGHGITFTSVGFGGGSYNDALLERLANRGDGAYVFIDSHAEAKRVFGDQLIASLQTIAFDAKIQVEFNPQRVRRYRLIGYENRAIADKDFRNDSIDAGEVGSGQSSTALYELELFDTDRDKPADLGTVYVRYRDAQTKNIEEISHRLTGNMIKRRTPANSARFYLAACAAEFAEILRQSEHARGARLDHVEQMLHEVCSQLPLDTRAKELLELVTSARGLPAAP